MSIDNEHKLNFEAFTPKKSNKLNGNINSKIVIAELLQQKRDEQKQMLTETQQSEEQFNNIKMALTDYREILKNFEISDGIETEEQRLYNEICRLNARLTDECLLREGLLQKIDTITEEKLSLSDLCKELQEENFSNINKIVESDNSDFYDERELSYRKRKLGFERRILELEEEVDEINDNYDISQQERIKLQVQVEKLMLERDNKDNEREIDLESFKSSHLKNVKDLELLLEEDREKRKSLVKEKSENERIIIDLKEQLEKQRDIILERKLKKELRDTRDKLNEALDHIDDLCYRNDIKSDIKLLRIKLDDTEHDKDIAHRQNIIKDREIEECRQDIDLLRKGKEDFENKLKNCKMELFNLQNANEDYEADIKEMERKHKFLQKQNAAIVDENSLLNERIDNVEEENKKLSTELEKAREQVLVQSSNQSDKVGLTRLQNRLSEVELKLQFEEGFKSRLQASNDRLKEQLLNVMSEKNDIENTEKMDQDSLKKLQKKLKEARNENEKQTVLIIDNSKSIEMLNFGANELQEELESKKAEISQLQRNVQRLEQLLSQEEEEDSEHNFSEVLTKADSMIKRRKFSLRASDSLQRFRPADQHLTPGQYNEC